MSNEGWDQLASCVAEFNGWPAKTPKGEFTSKVTTEVVAVLFGFGRNTLAEYMAYK